MGLGKKLKEALLGKEIQAEVKEMLSDEIVDLGIIAFHPSQAPSRRLERHLELLVETSEGEEKKQRVTYIEHATPFDNEDRKQAIEELREEKVPQEGDEILYKTAGLLSRVSGQIRESNLKITSRERNYK